MANPEFRMKGVSFVISSTTNTGHPLPFRIRLANGKWAEIQHSLRESFEIKDVVAELRLLADNLETMQTLEVWPNPPLVVAEPSPLAVGQASVR